ncbi:nucleotidyl transferase AbiEii/AbiGii toxin family protein [Candidatus Enterococcus ferrettii]|uniref:Nucleotidyl transferase AbiEii/AbiGii toxin family protein n=1 Tax=Candidatus Enterococcus ferrettii TaxID=2815324 RepID=A0ABV0EN30_9ENTE|nr:nucleotidyl transferase AbiEii/AbiGii toxin family protein [Enterococcus sp. 665A]MBO1338481.1 nucleotidyl transferase AbiEii/AbiGii toxin family protein [Enterococcus sp. 665A]
MIEFAKQSDSTRREAFTAASQQLGMNEAIIEKDFYVVLMQEILFHHCNYRKHFAFKGGTSLSKAYGIIKRFSEDIDVVMDWSLLGLSDGEVWQVRSNTQQDKFNRKINRQAGVWIEEILIPDIRETLKLFGIERFNVYVREADKQTVIIEYPRSFNLGNILPEIRLEIGPLAAWTPSEEKIIKSYVAEIIPNAFPYSAVIIPTVEAKRTFWEKVTILHKEANRRNDNFVQRISRHYYDVYMLGQTAIKAEALSDVELLNRVVRFKKKFYLDNSARYEEATIKKLKLLPKEGRLQHLQQDYQVMGPMFFEKPPAFEEIINYLQQLEQEIHDLKD